MTTAQLVPALLIPLVIWRVYRRIRRNVGRQPWRAKRLIGAVSVFSLITLVVAAGALRYPQALGALGGGLAVAVVISVFALRLTKFETTPEGKFYTPNTPIALAVTLLFVGRVVYRIVVLLGTTEGRPPSYLQNPLTLFFFGITAGYYIAYYLGVYLRGPKDTASAGT